MGAEEYTLVRIILERGAGDIDTPVLDVSDCTRRVISLQRRLDLQRRQQGHVWEVQKLQVSRKKLDIPILRGRGLSLLLRPLHLTAMILVAAEGGGSLRRLRA